MGGTIYPNYGIEDLRFCQRPDNIYLVCSAMITSDVYPDLQMVRGEIHSVRWLQRTVP